MWNSQLDSNLQATHDASQVPHSVANVIHNQYQERYMYVIMHLHPASPYTYSLLVGHFLLVVMANTLMK